MSVDKDVTENVMEILEDGRDGFNDAAEKLRDSERPDLAPRFEAFGAQRAQFYTELEQMAAAYGDDIDEEGSVKATMHRAWMAIKDTLSGDSPEGVLDAAEQGEEHAVEAYEDALKHDKVSPNLRSVLERQLAEVRRTHAEVKSLRDAAA